MGDRWIAASSGARSLPLPGSQELGENTFEIAPQNSKEVTIPSTLRRTSHKPTDAQRHFVPCLSTTPSRTETGSTILQKA